MPDSCNFLNCIAKSIVAVIFVAVFPPRSFLGQYRGFFLLSNAYLLAKFGFDTAENEPSKVCPPSPTPYLGERQRHHAEHRGLAAGADLAPVCSKLLKVFALIGLSLIVKKRTKLKIWNARTSRSCRIVNDTK